MHTNQLTSSCLTEFFTNFFFSKQAIEVWILILIIPQNMLKLYAKRSTLNMTEFASLKKIHTKIIIVKRNIQVWDVSDLSGFI